MTNVSFKNHLSVRDYHLSPFPERKTMLVSGSKRGTRMPEETSRERRCCGLDSFLEVEMIRKALIAIKKLQNINYKKVQPTWYRAR